MDWTAVKSYFDAKGVSRLVEHQIESFEDFIRNKIPLIVSSTAPIVVWHEQDETTKKYKYEFRLSFENITYMKPRIQEATGRVKPMFPQEARVRNFTYAAQMFCDVRFTARAYKGNTLAEFDESVRVFSGVSLGKIPVMVGSKYCLLHDQKNLAPIALGECAEDYGGYFIVGGGERVIICQERMAANRPVVFRNNRNPTKEVEVIEVKSIEILHDVHKKQLLTYLKLSGKKLGILVNFNVVKLVDKESLIRIIN